MKLLLATQNFGPAIGGIEQYCCELARALSAEGAQITVLAPEHAAASEHDARLPYEVVRYAGGAANELGLARALLGARARTFDAFVCLQWTSAIVPAIGPRARLAIVCHGKEVMPVVGTSLRARAERLARTAVLRRADRVIAVSRFTAEHAIAAGARPERACVIHPGVDAAPFAAAAALRSARASGPRLLTVARLVQRKGIDTVLRALPAIAERHPTVRYAIAGQGPDRPRLEDLVAQLGLAARVDWLGYVSHEALPPLYASADLFALPSRSIPERGDIEGFGLVLLEAQAAGTPVIAARSGGMPDAVQDGVTGVLIAPDDDRGLARAASELLADEDRRARMGEAARAFAANKSWRATARAFLAALA